VSARQDRSDAAFSRAQRAHDEPPEDDDHDWLADKPKGFCPWCVNKLFTSSETEWTGYPFCPRLSCEEYDSLMPEEANRERYARQMERDDRDERRATRADL